MVGQWYLSINGRSVILLSGRSVALKCQWYLSDISRSVVFTCQW